jgi:glutathione S-transferase
MKLYYSPGTCSLAVHIALREAGLSPELARVDLMTHRMEDGGDYHAINPRGYVPLLEMDDGSRHTEAAALLQHVADTASSRLIAPAGSAERLEITGWLTFVGMELHRVFGPLWHKDSPDATKQEARAKIAKAFAELDAVLARRDFLAAGRFTVADAYCFTVAGWARMLAIDMAPYPALGAYLGRIASRPAVHAAMAAEGLVKA